MLCINCGCKLCLHSLCVHPLCCTLIMTVYRRVHRDNVSDEILIPAEGTNQEGVFGHAYIITSLEPWSLVSFCVFLNSMPVKTWIVCRHVITFCIMNDWCRILIVTLIYCRIPEWRGGFVGSAIIIWKAWIGHSCERLTFFYRVYYDEWNLFECFLGDSSASVPGVTLFFSECVHW